MSQQGRETDRPNWVVKGEREEETETPLTAALRALKRLCIFACHFKRRSLQKKLPFTASTSLLVRGEGLLRFRLSNEALFAAAAAAKSTGVVSLNYPCE